MACLSIRKQCTIDNSCKQGSVTNCEGCSKAFCVKHFTEHRRLLDEEMNVIISEHDHLKSTLNQHAVKPDHHPLFKDINNWEKESMAKIQQRAKELRQELLLSTNAHEKELTKKLQQLSEKLKKSRESDDYIEADLQCWKKILDNLKTDLNSQLNISINKNDNVVLIPNVSITSTKVTSDLFERVSDNRVQIQQNGKVALSDKTQNATEARGKKEYKSGRHEIRLFIEKFINKWIFFGINSKLTQLQNSSYRSASTYGWSSNDYMWVNGTEHRNNSNSPIEMKMNDIIVLILDCDNRKISLINERTKAKHELVVNIDSCPFPWQFQVNLYEPDCCVRVLNT